MYPLIISGNVLDMLYIDLWIYLRYIHKALQALSEKKLGQHLKQNTSD